MPGETRSRTRALHRLLRRGRRAYVERNVKNAGEEIMRHPLRAALALLGLIVAVGFPFELSAQAPAALTGLVS
jgi:hypothetical protein